MTFLIPFLKAFLSTAGVLTALVMGLIYFKKMMRKGPMFYKAEELFEAFRIYLQRLKEEEKYEDIPEVREILKALNQDEVPDEVENYELEWDPEINLFDEEGNDSIKLNKSLFVVGKKEKKSKKQLADAPHLKRYKRFARFALTIIITGCLFYYFRENIFRLFS